MTMFLGLQICQDSTRILLHQGKYVEDTLEKFGFKDSKAALTPMAERPLLSPDPDGESADQTEYRSMIRSLMYLTATRPVIMFAVSDCNYGGCELDGKSTSGGCQFLGDRLVSWQCKKQQIVTTSTAEAEYVVAFACCSQVILDSTSVVRLRFEFS
ncbi:hypothetical protein Lser_V15G04005 [Lactuca serriola]